LIAKKQSKLDHSILVDRNSLPIKKQKIRIDETALMPKPEAFALFKKLQELQLKQDTLACKENPEPYIDIPHTIDEDRAEELCHGCPLLKACYQFAEANNEQWGIWGGINFTTETHIEELFE
jgi:hypothetical protein